MALSEMALSVIYRYREHINKILADPEAYPNLSRNPHPAAVEYLIRNPKKINWDCFSSNENQQAVEYMIHHPTNINWSNFQFNRNKQAEMYRFQHRETLDLYIDPCTMDEQIVEYLIHHPVEIRWPWFSWNATQQAVVYMLGNLGPPNYLLQHPETINWGLFSSITYSSIRIKSTGILSQAMKTSRRSRI